MRKRNFSITYIKSYNYSFSVKSKFQIITVSCRICYILLNKIRRLTAETGAL